MAGCVFRQGWKHIETQSVMILGGGLYASQGFYKSGWNQWIVVAIG